MAVSFVATSTPVVNATSTVTATLPTGTASGDIVYLTVVNKPATTTPATPAGWTLVTTQSLGTGTVGSGTGPVRITVFDRVYDSVWTMPAVTTGGTTPTNEASATAFRPAAGEAFIAETTTQGSDTTSGTGFSVTGAANLTVTTGDMILAVAGTSGNATATTPTMTATGATLGSLTERADLGNAGGNLGSIKVHTAAVTAGTSSAAPVHGVTLSAASTGGVVFVRVRSVVPTPITWSGHTWNIRTGIAAPGPNTWGSTTSSVDVSGTDLLLKIQQIGGVWTSAELQRQGGSLGYGRYRWTYTLDAAAMDIKPVLGFFTYESDIREIDIETTKWNAAGETSRQWYTNQPTSEPAAGDHTMSAATPYTAEFVWEATQIYWRTLDANGVLLGEHVVNSNIPPVGAEQVRMNLWLVGGAAPTDGLPVTATIHSFDFTASTTHALTKGAVVTDPFDDPYGWALRDGAAITSGDLVLPCGTTYSSSYTGSVIDIRESSTQIDVSEVPASNGNFSQEALWFTRYDADNYILVYWAAGSVSARLRQAGVNSSTVAMGTYNASTHRFWRVQHSGTTITFRTSGDGVTWTTRGTLPTTLTAAQLTTMRTRLESGHWAAETSPGQFRVARLGAAPVSYTTHTVKWPAGTAAPTAPPGDPALTAGSIVATNMPAIIYNLPQYAPNDVWSVTHSATRATLAAAVTAGAYHSVTLDRTAGLIPSVLRIKAARGAASSPRGFAIRSSVDGYTADLVSVADIPTVRPPTGTLTQFGDYDISALETQTSVTFRIYHFAPSATAAVDFDDLEIDYLVVAAAAPVSESGSLAALVAEVYTNRTSATGDEAYDVPTSGQAATLAGAYGKLMTGDHTGAAADVDPLGYDVVLLSDTVTGRSHAILRERLTSARYWGLYVWSREASPSALVVEAPHTKADANTHTEAASLFDKANAKAFLMATAHRNSNAATDVDGDRVSDQANADGVVNPFQSVHATAAVTGSTVVQIHGYADATDTSYDVIVSEGQSSPIQRTQDVATALRGVASLRVGVYDGTVGAGLGATGNVQGIQSRAAGVYWLHVEQNSTTRSNATTRGLIEDTLAATLVTTSVVSSRTDTYGVRAAVPSSRTDTYGVRAAISQTVSDTYGVRSAVAASARTDTYSVAAAVAAAIRTDTYGVRAAIAATVSDTYAVIVAPATILNIGPGAGQNHFSLQYARTGDPSPSAATQADLAAGFQESPYFTTVGARVQFQARADAPIIPGSGGARAELREVNADGSTAGWDPNIGVHEFHGRSAITHLPPLDPEVVVAQLHDGNSDGLSIRTQLVSGTIRLRARVYGTSITSPQFASPYVEGTEFEWKIRVDNGAVSFFYNDMVTPFITRPAGTLVPTAGVTTWYWKTGSYNQFDAASATATEYASVELRDLAVTHPTLASVENSATDTYAVRAIATSSVSDSQAVRAIVTGTASDTYAVRKSVAQTVADTYGVRALVIDPVSDTYAVRTSIAQTVGDTYAVRTAVAASTRADTYAVRAVVAQSAADSYAVQAPVANSRADTYGVRAIAATSRTETYAVVAGVVATRSDTYAVRTSAAQSAGDTWAVRGSVTGAKSDTYAVRAVVTNSVSEAFNVLVIGITTVTGTRSDTYAVRAAVAGTSTDTYAVRAALVTNRADTYAVRVAVQQAAADTYGVRGAVASTRADTFAMQASVSSTRADSWAVRALASAAATEAWSVFTAVAPAVRTDTWSVRGGVLKPAGDTWAVRALATGSRTDTHAVRVAVLGSAADTWQTFRSAARAVADSYAVRALVVWEVAEQWDTAQATPPLVPVIAAPSETLVVSPESRTMLVVPESRTLVVQAAVRAFVITGS